MDELDGLLIDNPFLPPKSSVAAPEPPPPQYEFRGRSVENGVEYFSVYNVETKKARWVSDADDGDLRVKHYDSAGGLVLTDQSGRNIRLALKAAKPSAGGGMRRRETVGLASAAVARPPSTTAAPNSSAEAQQLEEVAEQVRARRAQRQQSASRG